jgi:SAM-dependent methyltransferase
MRLSRFVYYCAAALFIITIFAGGASPEGQAGVIYNPHVTTPSLVETMLDLANLQPEDRLVDLGSGDGRIVIAAARRGARVLGIEHDPGLVAIAKRNATEERVGDKAQFVVADIFETDFSDATVITMFLLQDLNLKLRPQILDLRPGTRIVSNTFDMGDWNPDETARAAADCSFHCTAYLWIVPAKVGGTWKSGDGHLTLTQKFQTVTGSLTSGRTTRPITAGRLKGDEIRFTAGEVEYVGRVKGNLMEGSANSGGITEKWSATRLTLSFHQSGLDAEQRIEQ